MFTPPAFGAPLEADRPPEGTRSLFDFIFTAKGPDGYRYDIPTSIEEMTAKLRSLGAGQPLVLLVPMGRSVQRLSTSLADPRVLFTLVANPARPTQGLLPPAVRGRLFMGYGRKADQLEVISWNEGAARFEFQVVRNLGNRDKQEVVYAPRAFCGSCHFSREPIFPRNPWEETTAFPATARAVIRELGDTKTYHGVPVAQPNNNAYEFDRLTDAGADMLTYQRVWREGCNGGDALTDGGIDCRSVVTKLAFRNMFDYFIPTDSGLYVDLKARFVTGVKATMGEEIAFPLADLETRNPLSTDGGFNPGDAAADHGGLGSGDLATLRDKSSVPPPLDPLSADSSREDPLMHHPWRKVQPSKYAYPRYKATPIDRPKIRKTDVPGTLNEFIAWVGAELLVDFDFWQHLYNVEGADEGSRYAKLDHAIDQLAAAAKQDRANLALAFNGTFNPTKFAVGAAQIFSLPALQACCDHGASLPAIKDADSDLKTGTDLPQEERDVAKALTAFCWPCHKPGTGDLGFFTGDFSKIDAKLARKILLKLDWERCHSIGVEMPPAGAMRDAICEEGEVRQKMIEIVARKYFPGSSNACGPDRVREPARPLNAICPPP